jgi:REP element-mobilizing transposase RayT
MTPDLSMHQRRSIRVKGYDYTQPGAYFVTICTDQHGLLFGDVLSGQMRCIEYGRIAHEEWWKAERKRDDIQLDAWVVMPNHVHGIVRIFPEAAGTARRAPTVLPDILDRLIQAPSPPW